MTKSIYKSITRYFWFVLTVLLMAPLSFVGAQTPPPQGEIELSNPLKVGTIEELLAGILTIVMVIATPIIIFFIIYAGFLYVTAQGNPEKIKEAHRAITYAIIGGVIIIGALAIGEIIKNLVGAFKP